MACRPHRWNIEDWLPLNPHAKPEDHPSMQCLRCGRTLAVTDTTSDMRASIASGIATRLFMGDEYSEVYDAVQDYFLHHITGAPILRWVKGATNQ